MGLFAKLRGEFVDIIEWIDDTRHTLAWRFPRYHNQIKNGAQLIVRPGQVAIFVEQGRIADVFQPGRYELTTENLPILSTLRGWMHGFDSPFKAEVYFVSTRQITELKWGTPNPVILRDPDFGPVRVRAFGTYALKANDPKALLEELIGTDGVLEAGEIQELMRSVIATAFADLLASSEIPVLDLARSYQELSERLRKEVVERVDDEYGLDVPQLFVVNISLPEEVEKALDARSSMGVLGDLGRYQQYQTGRAITEAAANPAGGGAAEGIGMGMGFALAGQMARQMGEPAGTPAAAPPPPPGARMWHVAEAGEVRGPISTQDLIGLIGSGRVSAETLVWSAGFPSWLPAGQVPELVLHFAPPPPPPPPPPPA